MGHMNYLQRKGLKIIKVSPFKELPETFHEDPNFVPPNQFGQHSTENSLIGQIQTLPFQRQAGFVLDILFNSLAYTRKLVFNK